MNITKIDFINGDWIANLIVGSAALFVFAGMLYIERRFFTNQMASTSNSLFNRLTLVIKLIINRKSQCDYNPGHTNVIYEICINEGIIYITCTDCKDNRRDWGYRHSRTLYCDSWWPWNW